jgi:hypothetical protein
MKLTKNHKIIIGVVGLGILAYATKKYWMPKKKTTSTTPTGNVSTQSAPISTSASATPVAPKREELINYLKNQIKEEGKGFSVTFDNSLFFDLTDKDLLSIKVLGDVEKMGDKIQEKDIEKVLKDNNLTKLDIQNGAKKLADVFSKSIKK